MSPRKYASTESADAFAEAVGGGAPDAPEGGPASHLSQLEDPPASWSNSENLGMVDELALGGTDTGVPDVKTAALVNTVNALRGPYADIVKEAVVGASALRLAGRGAKAVGEGAAKGARGVGALGKKSRNFLHSRGKFKDPTIGQAATRIAPETAFHTHHVSNLP